MFDDDQLNVPADCKLSEHMNKFYLNTMSLSRHEQVCLMRLRFERYFSHHRDDDHMAR